MMNRSHYVLLDTSKLSNKAVSSILKKLCDPYEGQPLCNTIKQIDQYILACNPEDPSAGLVSEKDGSYLVSKGTPVTEWIKMATCLTLEDIIPLVEKMCGYFSFILRNRSGEWMMATDRHGMEPMYIGYGDNDVPVLFTNYHIGMYFKDCYDFKKIITMIPGSVGQYRKDHFITKSYVLDGAGVSSLDAMFAPLLGDTEGSDWETKKGIYGTSVLDRIMCWEDTQTRSHLYPIPKKSSSVYAQKDFFTLNPSQGHSTMIDVIHGDWVDRAISMKQRGLQPLILNMTDRQFPGCNLHLGTGGQEETIFRRTNLAQTLLLDFYPFHVDNRVILSPHVTVFKRSEKDGWTIMDPVETIGVVSCPPVPSPYGLEYDYTNLFENAKLNKEHESVTRTYLELVFQTAVRMDFDSLVLPAFGCEGHHHPPRHVATIIKELTKKYSGYLKEVVVCMPEINDHVLGNYHIFREIFGLDKEIIESTPLEVSTISEDDNKEVVLDEILEKVEEEKI
jgi:uncharacterized protein (TIGR02452 family)